MKRRQFISLAAVGTAGLVWPARGRPDASDPLATLARPRLLDVLRNQRIVRELGRRYRVLVPAENDPRALAGAILTDANTATPEMLAHRVNERVQRDFAEDRTITVDGWVLSLTEARQCALYSMA
jgi:hypothetical protein